LEIVEAKRGPATVAVFALPDETRLAQHPEMVGQGRGSDVDGERSAGPFGVGEQRLDDRHPGGIRQGMQDIHFKDIDGARHVLAVGDTVDVPRGTKHTFANAGADEMRVRFEFRPALPSTDRFYELYFAFAQQGRVNAKAMPSLLDIATVWPVTSEHAVLATPPAVIQHARFRVLTPAARIANRHEPVCRLAQGQTNIPR